MGLASHVCVDGEAKTLEASPVCLVSTVAQTRVGMAGKKRIERYRNEDSLARGIEPCGPVLRLVIALPRCDDEVTNKDADTDALVRGTLANPVTNGERYECLKPILSGHEAGSLSGRRNLAHLAEGYDENKS
ncbi:hypothetical protein LK12_03505 [Novosphingobium malaysiense]|uniref:Uncharacterized protein n=1 Tax=Novosphingobium malaysiense TaxID=1348853 RepID=A0A0B1ZV80_9SPHN|nr:hypothetical protein LK12_03505 [Novosphingobium malaysiense]